MTKGTIVRSIMLVLVIVNIILKAFGKDVINADEATVASTVEMLISIAVIVLSWWKNNSITKNAKKADKYLNELKELEAE